MMKKLVLLAVTAALFLSLAACSIETKDRAGKTDVKIDTPVGNLRVKADKDIEPDTGLAVYPGAALKQEGEHDRNTAKVDLATGFFGLKVRAATYTTADDRDKVRAFYEKELSRYGTVIVCKGEIEDRDSGELYCDSNGRNNDEWQIGVGRKDHQRIVAVKPSGAGTEFSLVHVQFNEKKDGGEMM